MSTSLRRHNRVCLDAAMRRVCSSLDRRQRTAFLQLALVVRAQSDLMATPPDREGAFVQLQALRNLSYFHRGFVREPSAWTGASGHPVRVIHSFASHLLTRYPVPRFFASVWFGDDDDAGREKRRWFIEHGMGASLRSAIPLDLTRAMAHEFLRSCDHVSVEYALRYAEVIGLGGTPELAREICATRLGKHLDNAAFWRTAVMWFINLGDALDFVQVGPIVDYLQAVRHECVRVETRSGVIVRPAPQPAFSLKGRTFGSVMRLVEVWHRSLSRSAKAYSWQASRWRGLHYEVDLQDGMRLRWTVVNLTDSDQLRREGRQMRHCVASYGWRCQLGVSEIWSLRRMILDDRYLADETEGAPFATIEIQPKTGTIVQLRGRANARVSGQALELVRMWAARERLMIATYA